MAKNEAKTEEKMEKPFDITRKKFRVRLEKGNSDEENAQYVCNGQRGVQVMRGVDVMVPFKVREALRMADDARAKAEKYEQSAANVAVR